MALQFKLATLDGLSEAQKALYTRAGEFYLLDIEPSDDEYVGLCQQKERLLGEVKELRKKLKDMEAESAARAAAPAAKSHAQSAADAGVTDLVELEKARFLDEAEQRLSGAPAAARAVLLEELKVEGGNRLNVILEKTVHAQWKAKLAEQQTALKRVLREHAAAALVRDLAQPGSEAVLRPHVEARLEVELGPLGGADGHIVRVLGRDGKPSGMTVEALAAEIRGDSAMAPVVRQESPAEVQRRRVLIDQALGRVPLSQQSATRSEFEAFSASRRADFLASGGQISGS